MHEDTRSAPRVEVGLSIRLAYGSIDEFIERYALNISLGGMFVRTRDPQPAGTPLAFDLQIETGEKVIHGRGVVAWTTAPSAPGEPLRLPGMGIRFTELDPESRALVDLVVATRGAAGREEEPPVPPDVEPIRGSGDAAPAEAVAGGAAPGPAPSPEEAAPGKGRVVGIDLGTTNSCVAVAQGSRARVLASRQGYGTIPSVVAFDSQGRLLVGHPAKAQMIINPRNTVYGSKRLVGRQLASATVQSCRDRFHYDIVEGSGGQAAVQFAGRSFSLQQISAFILAEMRAIASEALEEPVTRAVVTVPAYYNDHQRQAVREAGALAGLHVERIVNEPTAAALAFGHARGLEKRVLVYDLGGGTFDASVLEIQGDVYEVISTGGDTFLGGVDFDGQLVDHLAWAFEKQNGFRLPDDRVVWQRLRDAAEETKVALSSRETAIASVPYLCQDREGNDVDLKVTVTRAELEQMTGRLVDRTLEVCREVLSARGLVPADVQEVLLVGGQSRMPLVWRRVREEFGREPNKAVHPDEAVALGAALLADSQRRIDSVVLIDVLSMGIGVGLPGGQVAPVLPRNTRLPASRSYQLATVRDGQTEIELPVVQGDSPRVSECEYLGTLRLSGLPGAPKGAVKAIVEFSLGAEGLLSVVAREVANDRTTRAEFTTLDTPSTLREKLRFAEVSTAPRGARPVERGERPRDGVAAGQPVPASAPRAGSRRGLLGRLLRRR